ncbi:hypothetical protein [uncultured Adlercreutzia sp.]|uniref:hypothetical protein n=1 Tax=uncultured Adlercreutzia sp. TaxID=875803 RepID=UPI0025EBF99C|nr:hypothetical protein [uncultured Adlercreutzia sp.]
MITYPVLSRSAVVKDYEFDDVRYTMALLLAMAASMGVSLEKLVGLLEMQADDVDGLLEDATCNHSLPFEASVSEMLARFGATADEAPIPPYGDAEDAAEIPSLLIELVAFNSERSESTALYDLMADGTLDWLGSDDFKSLPVPLNQVAGEWIDGSPRAVAA